MTKIPASAAPPDVQGTGRPRARRVLLLGTGGTIAGVADRPLQPSHYQAGVVPVGALRQAAGRVPGLRIRSRQVAQIDSKDMGPIVWQKLLRAVHAGLEDAAVDGIVVTHGSDTMEETAFLLQAMLHPLKPVVLTGAMRPSTHEAADGPANLAMALRLAAQAPGPGVLLAFAGEVHEGWAIQKLSASGLRPFGVGDQGPLFTGTQAPWTRLRPTLKDVRGGRVWGVPSVEALLRTRVWPRVDWISSHADADGALVRDLLAARGQSDRPLQGLVVAGTGGGTLNEGLRLALTRATQAGVRVWRCTRCAWGRQDGRDDVSYPDMPLVALTPAQARVAMTLDLIRRQSMRPR